MIAALAGNGPSAMKYAAEIDAHPFVVRMSNWKRYYPAEGAGRKMSAWAAPFYPKDNRQTPPGKGWEMWMTCPLEWHKGRERFANAERLAAAHDSEIRICPLSVYTRLRQHLSANAGRSLPPSTGILAVAVALALPQITGLVLYGFDAGLAGACLYANGRKGRYNLHAFAAEARALDELVVGRWLGEKAPKPVEWRRP